MCTFRRQLRQSTVTTILAAVTAALLASCDNGTSGPADGGTTIPASDGGAYDASRPDTGIGFDVAITPPAPPQFKDWDCPEGWVAAPGFTDENGVVNPPDGVKQFNICKPPENWAPVQMKDWDCPEGWLKVPMFTDENGIENPPEGVAQFNICMPPDVPECPDGEVAYVGETACHLIGTECPTGDFHDEATIKGLAPTFAGKVIYVLAGATGGDGTPTTPFGTVASAIAAAAAGDSIALSKGTFLEGVTVTKAVALIGSCVGGTTIDAEEASTTAGAVEFVASGASRVTNVRVSGNRNGVYVHGTYAKSVVLERIEVNNSLFDGILVKGSTNQIQLDEVAVRDTRGGPDGTMGYGVRAIEGAKLSGQRSVVERNHSAGVVAGIGTNLSLGDVVIRDTHSDVSDKLYGFGFEAVDGAVGTITRAVIERNRSAGAIIGTISNGAPGPTLELNDVVIRDTQSAEADGTGGEGLVVNAGCRARVTRAMIDRNRSAGALVGGSTDASPAELELTDVIIRDTRSRESDGQFGTGLDFENDSEATINRTVVERNRCFGIIGLGYAGETPPQLTFTDLVVRDTRSQEADGRFGDGMEFGDGAIASITRTMLVRNRSTGIWAGTTPGGEPPILALTDVAIRDTEGEEADGRYGGGLAIINGGEVTVNRAVVETNKRGGISAIGLAGTAQPKLELTDVVVRENGGDGLSIGDGAVTTAARTVIERNRRLGVLASADEGEAGPKIDMTDVIVRDTLPMESDNSFGRGVEINRGAEATITRAVVERNLAIGVSTGAIAGAATPKHTLTLSDAVIRDTRSEESDKKFGRGLEVDFGGSATVSRAVIEKNREIGVVTVGLDGETPPELELTDVVIRGTKTAECGEIPEGQERSCIIDGFNDGGGTALGAYIGATVSVNNFEFHGNALCGIQIARDAKMTATNGDIHGNAIGVNSQVEGYDITTVLSSSVRVHDNDTNVDSKELPIPDPAKAIGSVDSSEQ